MSEAIYKVIKETIAWRVCRVCGGAGQTKRQFRGNMFKETCSACLGSGKEKITHRTEVPLEEAIKNINNKNNENKE